MQESGLGSLNTAPSAFAQLRSTCLEGEPRVWGQEVYILPGREEVGGGTPFSSEGRRHLNNDDWGQNAAGRGKSIHKEDLKQPGYFE